MKKHSFAKISNRVDELGKSMDNVLTKFFLSTSRKTVFHPSQLCWRTFERTSLHSRVVIVPQKGNWWA